MLRGAITDEGSTKMRDWVVDLLRNPTGRPPLFQAALSLMSALPGTKVVHLLKERIEHLQTETARIAAELQQAESLGLPRLLRLDTEYRKLLLEAELTFVRGVIAGMEAGSATRRHED